MGFTTPGLMTFVAQGRNRIRAWDPHADGELPAVVVAKFLGVSVGDIYAQKYRGRLADYRPETVRAYLSELTAKKLSHEMKSKSDAKLKVLRAELRRLRRLVKFMRSNAEEGAR